MESSSGIFIFIHALPSKQGVEMPFFFVRYKQCTVQAVRTFKLGLIPTESGTKTVCKAQTVCLAKSIQSLVKLYSVLYRKENGCGKKYRFLS
jgi:hypothetical protein